MEQTWKFGSFDDVERFGEKVRNGAVRARNEKEAFEFRRAAFYLLALGANGLLTYSFEFSKGESPDFMLTWPSGETSGLEVTKATTEKLQEAEDWADKVLKLNEAKAIVQGTDPEPVMIGLDPVDTANFIKAAQSRLGRRADPSLPHDPGAYDLPLVGPGWAGDSPEHQWCELVLEKTKAKLEKLPKYRSATYQDLLIYNDPPQPITDYEQVIASLMPKLKDLTSRFALSFRTVSIELAKGLAFDLTGDPRPLTLTR